MGRGTEAARKYATLPQLAFRNEGPAKSRQAGRCFFKNGANSGRTNSHNFGRLRPTQTEMRPKVVEILRIWATCPRIRDKLDQNEPGRPSHGVGLYSTKIGLGSRGFGRISAEIDEHWPESAKVGPDSVTCCPTPTEFDQNGPESNKIGIRFGPPSAFRTWPNLARYRPRLCRCGRSVAGFRQNTGQAGRRNEICART